MGANVPAAHERQLRHSMPCATPPKLPRSQARTLPVRGRTRSSSPRSAASIPTSGVAAHAAAAAAAEVVAVVARQGPSRRALSAHGGSRGASPEPGRGFQNSHHSLSSISLLSRGPASSYCGSFVAGSARSLCSTVAPSESGVDSSIHLSESSRQEAQQVCHYSGVFSHPSFGPDEISIEVTLDGSCKGWWKALEQREEITVIRNGKSIVLVDRSSTTTFDGHEVVGGMLVDIVSTRRARWQIPIATLQQAPSAFSVADKNPH